MKNMKNVYVKIDEKLYDEVSGLTKTDYGKKGDEVNVEALMQMVEDLLVEYHRSEETLQDVLSDMEDNYKPLTNKEMYD